MWDQSPGSELDYTIDLTEYLAAEGDGIASFTFDMPGMTVITTKQTSSKVSAFVTGGAVGDKPIGTFRITTDSSPPRVAEFSFQLYIGVT